MPAAQARLALFGLLLAAVLSADAAASTDPTSSASTGDFFPDPITPADNPLTPEKIALGKRLFSEIRLSVNNTYSCASCHQPSRHFTDGRRLAVGATGATHHRHTPTLYNVAFNTSFGWEDMGLRSLEQQHLVPLLNREPVEMGFTDSLLRTLAQDATYVAAYQAAFDDTSITLTNSLRAIASYVRTLRAPQSAFDRYLFHDEASAMSAAARNGMALFFSGRLGCSSCHASLNFSGPIRHALMDAEPVFHITAVGGSSTPFRAPTLRAIRHTAPYMHDGSVPDLMAVIRHYETVDAERIPEFKLTEQERGELVAFLETL